MADKIAKRGISIYIDGKEVANSVKGIRGEMQKLVNEQSKMTIGSDNYIAHAKKIAYLDSLYQEHRLNQKAVSQEYKKMGVEADSYAKKAESSISKMANGINKYFAMFTAGLAAVTGLTLGLKKFMDERNKVQDSAADLKALTGLDDASVNKLQGFAKKMSENPLEGTKIRIKASVAEILEAYKLVGSAKPELLKDADALNEVTKQSMILSQAAGMPLADAVRGTVIALNQYSAGADQAAKYVNILAAGAQAGAQEVPYITEALVKFGAVAKLANVPIEQSVALIEAIGEKGFQAEVAGTGIKTFFTKLLQGADETNPAIVGMHTALENLNKKFSGKGGFSEMTKLFGQDNVVVAQTLIANRARFDELTIAVTGTNTAIDQATITSATNSAKMAQAQNKFMNLGMELVKNLNPAMLKATNIGNAFLKMIVQIPKYWEENKTGVIAFTAALLAYGVALNAAALVQKGRLVLAAIEKVADYVKIASLRVRIILTGEATIAELRLIAAQKALNASMMVNIYAAVAVAIAAITYGIYKLITAQSLAQKAWKDYSVQSEIEISNSNQLFDALKKTNSGSSERKLLIDKINSVYGEYLTNQLNEKSNLNDINLAQAAVNQGLREKIGLQMKENAKNDITKKYVEEQVDAMDSLKNSIAKQKGEDMGNVIKDEVENIIKQHSGDLELGRKMAQNYLKSQGDFGDAIFMINKYVFSLENMNKELSDVDKKFKVFEKRDPLTIYEPNDHKEKPKVKANNFGAAPDKPKEKDPYKEDLKLLENSWKESEMINTSAYARESLSEEEFHNFMYEDEKLFLEEKLKLQQKYGLNTNDTLLELAKLKLADTQYWNGKEKAEDKDLLDSKKKDVKTREQLAKDIADIMDNYGVDEAGRLKAQKELELKIAEEAYKKGIINAKQYAETIALINKKSTLPKWADDAQQIAGGIANVAGEFSSAMQDFQSAEEKSIETKYQKQIDAAQKAGKDTTKIEEKKNKELAALRAKNADSVFAVQIAMIAASTAESAISAFANTVKIPVVGPVLAPIAAAAAVAYGLSQVAQAEAAREAAKEGYTYGGFTPNVGRFTPAGTVHGGEFVSSMETVNNPNIKPFLDTIDTAQRMGTVGSLKKSDLAKALNINSTGIPAGNYTRTSTAKKPDTASSDNAYLMAILAKHVATLERLNKHLDDGIVAESVISGKKGTFEQTKRYEKLIKNANR